MSGREVKSWRIGNVVRMQYQEQRMIHDVCSVMSDEGGIYLSGWQLGTLTRRGRKGRLSKRNTIQNDATGKEQ